MKLRFFTIRIQDAGPEAEELNAFLSSHRILSVERHFVANGSHSTWAICVTYLPPGTRPVPAKSARVHYREILPAPEFELFVKLRNLRKALAEKEGVPAYALFTNEQLADMVRRRVTTRTALEKIEGVGPARCQKYGASFLEVLTANLPAPAGHDGKDVS
jgi:superfamily II DNA helicase RecQ